ncbi:hypothetical protein P148_SR1C00001G0615 [candidate division SR1 bacterium RAAC1_SR1_1]|nr:hypothetical protein P148_SR1C00001G0615 [candidate division SR1 bacterium RAAC1_SR1_1]
MIDSSDIILYKKKGFDGEKYIKLQKEAILKRISQFNKGRLYLEIGGKFLYDTHAARVLPGFIPESKKHIFAALKDEIEILFCVNASDILADRQLTNQDITYKTQVQTLIKRIEIEIGLKPHIVINNIDIQDSFDKILEFEQDFQRKNYRVWERYKIPGYPHNTKGVLSESGFGNDDHIPLTKNLVLVTGAASNSGKLSTCLGQIYNDHQIGIESGYAKYETFPIWNLPLKHPVNLAYEAATADINDYNMIDPYHKKAYNKDSVNYNRDVEAFEVIMGIVEKTISKENFMSTYKSPTDMGINDAGFCITDDEIVTIASLEEIKRRKLWYQQMIDRNEGETKRTEQCNILEKECNEYAQQKKYNLNQKIH